MSILLHRLPEELMGVSIASDFRRMILISTLMMDPSVGNAEKVDKALALFYPQGFAPLTAPTAFALLSDFLRAGQARYRGNSEGGPASARRSYDWEVDAPLIVAAFQQAYGIDLTSEHMHWWRFLALFDGLPADTMIRKIMEYRTADTSKLSKGQREYYDNMRRRYELPAYTGTRHRLTPEEHDARFIARLRHEPTP